MAAQPQPEWQRVYTFDDSIIEMNTSLLTPITRDVIRVRYRWIFNELQQLSGTPPRQYQSKLEVKELNCSENRARSYHITFLDTVGNIVHIDDAPGEWRRVPAGSMLQKMFVPACELIKSKTTPKEVDQAKLELERVAEYAHDVAQHLARTKDFQTIIDQFFVGNYLNRYLQDENTNWFLILDRATARKATYRELQRFYIAMMNAGYVGTLYIIDRSPSDDPEGNSLAELKKLVTPDVWRVVANHPYTLAHKGESDSYEFLADKVNDLKQLRGYTDLLEKMTALMRRHVSKTRAEQSERFRKMTEDWDLYEPKVRVCRDICLGLPAGTKLFDVSIPVFHLQIAETGGHLRVVSAIYSFR